MCPGPSAQGGGELVDSATGKYKRAHPSDWKGKKEATREFLPRPEITGAADENRKNRGRFCKKEQKGESKSPWNKWSKREVLIKGGGKGCESTEEKKIKKSGAGRTGKSPAKNPYWVGEIEKGSRFSLNSRREKKNEGIKRTGGAEGL